MLVMPRTGLDTDQPFWIRRDSFFRQFDQLDFRCREIGSVQNAYLADWFELHPSGMKYFKISTVALVSSGTQFMNGRHRAAVLLNFLDEIPIAFAVHHLSNMHLFKSLEKRHLDLTQEILIPDLPVKAQLP